MAVTTTWNPNDKNAAITLSNGNLTATRTSFDNDIYRLVRATHGLYRTGKGYFELVVGTANLDRWHGGIATVGESLDEQVGNTLSGWGYQAQYSTDYGRKYHSTSSQYGLDIVNGGIFHCAVDAVNGKVWFGGNGVWFESGNPETGANPAYADAFSVVYPAWSSYRTTNNATAHFSAASLVYAPPVGFSAWDDVAGDHLPGSRATTLTLQKDMVDGGAYQITGTVDEQGVSGSYRLGLFDRQSKRCIRETWSSADGSYSFPYVAYREKGYFIVAYDHGDAPLNAAIADYLTPELMI